MAEATVEPIEKKPIEKGPRLTFGEYLRRNPVMLKELRGRMRGSRAFLLVTGYLLALSLLVLLVYLVLLSSTRAGATANERQIFGKAIFAVVVGIELLTVSFVAPALTAGAISSERESQTYDLLRTTLLPARSLVLGKFLSGLVFLLLLLFTALPVQSLSFMYGGVSPEEVLLASLLLVVTAITFCAVGIFFSSLLARTLFSTVLSYAFVALQVFGLPMILLVGLGIFNAGAMRLAGQTDPAREALLIYGGWLLAALNPLATAGLTEAFLTEQGSIWTYSLALSSGARITLVSPWIVYVWLYLLVSAELLWASIRRVKRTEK